jgi:hypothetical protein
MYHSVFGIELDRVEVPGFGDALRPRHALDFSHGEQELARLAREVDIVGSDPQNAYRTLITSPGVVNVSANTFSFDLAHQRALVG